MTVTAITIEARYGKQIEEFRQLMIRELAANEDYKGGRSGHDGEGGWLAWNNLKAIDEILYHTAKLAVALNAGYIAGIDEYSADIANLAMMARDAARERATEPPPDAEGVATVFDYESEDFESFRDQCSQLAADWLGIERHLGAD